MLSIEYRPIESLIPYARNSRTHSGEQIAQIAASIREFGWTNPVLIDEDNGIIAGHGRVLAAQKLGLEDAPVIQLKNLSVAQKKAYIIADNKLALNAGWDMDMLAVEIEELNKLDFDLDLLGFDAVELAKLFDEQEELELKDEKYEEIFNIIIECKDEEEQEKIFNRLDEEGYKCRVQSL